MKLKTESCFVAALVLLSSYAIAADVSYLNGRSPGDQGPPFSGAVWVDDTLYVSGALGLVNGEVPEDPWGNAYEYRVSSSGIEIVSLGADGREGGAGEDGDVSN